MTAAATVADVLAGRASWCVVCGERDVVLASLGDAAVDVTITDPPYDERTHAGARTTTATWRGTGGARAAAPRVAIDFAPADPSTLAPLMLRVTRRWVVAFAALEQLGEYKLAAGEAWIRAGAWDRVAPTPQLTGDRPAQGIEGIAIMHRRGGGRLRWNGGGGPALWRHLRLAAAHGHTRHGHPTEKPVPLMRALVRDFSDPGELICDPHAGSGTTGVAALLEGRRVILVERDPEHAATCVARMEATQPGEGSRKAKQLALGGVR